jgi:hypothetical protein
MHVLFNPTDRVHNRAQRLCFAHEITMQLGFNCRCNERCAFFRRKGNAIEQLSKRHCLSSSMPSCKRHG